jgi:hypothetical protein
MLTIYVNRRGCNALAEKCYRIGYFRLRLLAEWARVAGENGL